MASPHTQIDSLRVHDLAVQAWLETLMVDYGNANGLLDTPRNGVPLLSVMATPDRAVAQLVDVLVLKGWLPADRAATLKSEDRTPDVMPTPFASIVRGDAQYDTDMRGVPKTIRGHLNDPLTGQPTAYQFPANMRTDYTISFWSQKRYTDNYIREFLLSQFGALGCYHDERLLVVAHGEPMGNCKQSFRMVSPPADTSSLEGNDPRYIRCDAVFSLRTYILKAKVQSWAGSSP